MLEAIVERVGDRAKISAPPAMLDYDVRARLGMYQTLHINRIPKLSAALGGLVPPGTRKRYGLVADRDITGILDASGFAYSDSFGPGRSRREAVYGDRWQRRGVPKVMLPQAFGPFTNSDVASWATCVLNQAQIVFARDTTSRQHLSRLPLSVPVEIAPDFTIGLDPLGIAMPTTDDYAAVVLNTKLVTQGVVSEPEYVSFMAQLGRAAQSQGLAVVVVVHETSDRRIASSVATQLDASTFDDPRPRALKAVIGGASLLIASRFHAIVGGLSQGVPTIALGWSHKYEELLKDFGVPDWTGNFFIDPDQTVNRVLADDAGAARMRGAKKELATRVESMWLRAEEILGI